MAGFTEDPQKAVKRRVREITRKQQMHPKEVQERRERAEALAVEDEKHLVAFLDDCVDHSVQSLRPIREEQAECWRVYNEETPPQYADKEEWQSQVVLPKPFAAVQFAMSVVRKAFDVQVLNIENEQNKDAESLWRKLMGLQLGRNRGKFPTRFTDSAGMGFAVGTSLEMIPIWEPGRGLTFDLAEPWKIHRDPDALSRDPQSGLYWIHQEWLDYHVLKEQEKTGRFVNVSKIKPKAAVSETPDDFFVTQEEIARRKKQVWSRSNYRHMVLVSEYWGTILDKNGEMLMPDATFTVAGGRVISPPRPTPYKTLRWPGMAFSPLPNFLRFDGRGLLTGVRSLWYFMCNLLCLHNDHLNWVVNPPVEINVNALVDPLDADWFPGKKYHTRDTTSGQQAVRTVDRKFITSEVLANMNFGAQNFDRGTLVHDVVQGLPGYRAEVTAREAAQNLEQSLTVFGLVGKNLEDGALHAIEAGAETVAANISYPELAELVGEELAARFRAKNDLGLDLPLLTTGAFHVSGISGLMRDWEIIQHIRDVIIPLFEGDKGAIFRPYLRPYQLLKSLENRLNLRDEGMLVDEQTAQAIDDAQQAVQEQQVVEAGALSAANTVAASMPPGMGMQPGEAQPNQRPLQ